MLVRKSYEEKRRRRRARAQQRPWKLKRMAVEAGEEEVGVLSGCPVTLHYKNLTSTEPTVLMGRTAARPGLVHAAEAGWPHFQAYTARRVNKVAIPGKLRATLPPSRPS